MYSFVGQCIPGLALRAVCHKSLPATHTPYLASHAHLENIRPVRTSPLRPLRASHSPDPHYPVSIISTIQPWDLTGPRAY